MAANDTTSTNPVPASVAALIRQAVLFIGGLAVGRGWVQADQLPGITTIVVTVGTAAWGLYKTFSRQKKVVVAESIIGSKITS